jgi:uncharacterized membrane protein YfcA
MLSQALSDVPHLWFWIAAGVAVTCLGFSKAGFIGFALIATPLLALFVPPLQAVAILLPIMLAQDFFSMWSYRHDWDRRNVMVTVPGALVGIGLAWFFVSHLSNGHIRLTVGVMALAFVLKQAMGREPVAAAKSPRKPPPAALGTFWGAVSGFTGTIANAGGPPILIYMLPQRLDKMTFVGTLAFFFAVLNAVKLVPIAALGQLSPGNLLISLVMLPPAIAANFLGIWLVRRAPGKLFYRIAYALLLLVGLAHIWMGVAALTSGSGN